MRDKTVLYDARFKDVLLVCMAEPFSGSVQWLLFLYPKDQVPQAYGYDPCIFEFILTFRPVHQPVD